MLGHAQGIARAAPQPGREVMLLQASNSPPLAVDGACGTAAVGALPSKGDASGAAIQMSDASVSAASF